MAKPEIIKSDDFIIQDVYYLEDLEQLQAISAPLRYQMITMLAQPKTGAQLARALKLSRARVHYHLKMLEEVGLVRFYGEGQSHGITEKYYQVVGRMLDFSRLIPSKEQQLIPNEITLETFNAVSHFLATMLDVSRESILESPETLSSGTGFWFDFVSVLTSEQIDFVKNELRTLQQWILKTTRENREAEPPREVIDFRITLFLTLFSDNFTQTSVEEE